jgi:hypothetical protein
MPRHPGSGKRLPIDLANMLRSNGRAQSLCLCDAATLGNRRPRSGARDDRDQQSSPWPGTEGSNPAPSAGPGPLTLIEGNASGSDRVYDSASLSLDRRASHAVWPRCRLFPLKRVRPVKAKGMGFSVRRQYVRYTAIARRPAAQGKSTARSARGTSATPNKPPLASWGAGALAGPQLTTISVTVNTPRL